MLQTTRKPGPKRPILIVLHQETSSPGRVGQILQQMGYGLDIRRPAMGDSLPETLDGHAGAAVFGGPMSANDDHDYIKREIDWLSVPLLENRPFLGICLGAQMLVRKLGGEVGPHVEGLTEIREGPTGARFDRHFTFTDADGKAVVRAKTTWAMIDRASGRLMRVPAEVSAPFAPPPSASRTPPP